MKDVELLKTSLKIEENKNEFLQSQLKERDFTLNVNDPYQFVLTDKKGNTFSFNPQKKWGEELNDFLVGNVNIKN